MVDSRVPHQIRQMLDEADGCLNMAFGMGGTACARKAVDLILDTEHAAADDYAASLLTSARNTRGGAGVVPDPRHARSGHSNR